MIVNLQNHDHTIHTFPSIMYQKQLFSLLRNWNYYCYYFQLN
uniref:Uncharacterized protein n=1 Tax=Schistosoma curassoni TaxID=6186 RepID=A0A183L2G3_9TREM